MKVNREELLHSLELVFPGLSNREFVEQSSCFVFRDGQVFTFNDEIACSHKIDLELEGAVQASSFLGILRKMPEVEVGLEISDGEITILGKRRKASLRMEENITLPFDSVEKPSKWKALPEDFLDAVKLVHECAGRDESRFTLTCLHIHPKWVEASDRYQISRYRLKTQIESPVLIRRDSIKHVVSLGMTEVSQTENWIHFRNPVGLVFSCRKYVEDYPDLTAHLKVEGDTINLPKGLKDAVERAEVFSAENADNNEVFVELRPGRLRIKSVGASGRYSEIKKVQYKGRAFGFTITPALLTELSIKYNECVISDSRLKVNGGKFQYVATLGKVED